jgi:hypothetical protein
MPMPLVMVQGTTTAIGELVIVSQVINAQPGGAAAGAPAPLANLQGATDASKRLYVKIV